MISALIIATGIVLAAFVYTKGQERWHVKPRMGKFQVNVVGRTEDAETMTISYTLFGDETAEQHNEKIQKAFELREARLKFQNERMLELQAKHKEGLEKARDERLKLVEKEQEEKSQA